MIILILRREKSKVEGDVEVEKSLVYFVGLRVCGLDEVSRKMMSSENLPGC